MITAKTTAQGFAYIEVENNQATAKIALQGGHLFHYQRTGHVPLLWLSRLSHFSEGAAIRGGIPICWPWFGKHPHSPGLPQHGFARTSLFNVQDSSEPDGDFSEIVLQLQDSAATRALWDHPFQLYLRIGIGETLSLSLSSQNTDTQDVTISAALHSYFAVSEIGHASVHGLEGVAYLDTLTGSQECQTGAVEIDREVDRVYHGTGSPILLHDGRRHLSLHSKGSASTVVWNPWCAKAGSMADMDNDGYQTMLCIETANALQDARTIEPGEEHRLQMMVAEMA